MRTKSKNMHETDRCIFNVIQSYHSNRITQKKYLEVQSNENRPSQNDIDVFLIRDLFVMNDDKMVRSILCIGTKIYSNYQIHLRVLQKHSF